MQCCRLRQAPRGSCSAQRTCPSLLRSCSAQPSASTAHTVKAAARRRVSGEVPADLRCQRAGGQAVQGSHRHSHATQTIGRARASLVISSAWCGWRIRQPPFKLETDSDVCRAPEHTTHTYRRACTPARMHACVRHSLHKLPSHREDDRAAEVDAECVECDGSHLVGRGLLRVLVAILGAGLTRHLTQGLYDGLQQHLVALQLLRLVPVVWVWVWVCRKGAGEVKGVGQVRAIEEESVTTGTQLTVARQMTSRPSGTRHASVCPAAHCCGEDAWGSPAAVSCPAGFCPDKTPLPCENPMPTHPGVNPETAYGRPPPNHPGVAALLGHPVQQCQPLLAGG